MSNWFIVAPFMLGVVLAAFSPVLTKKVQKAVEGQLALEARSYPVAVAEGVGSSIHDEPALKVPEELQSSAKGPAGGESHASKLPPYLREEIVVEDYIVYAADASQLFPAMLIPVIGAIFALGVEGNSSGLGIGFLLFTIIAAFVIDGWVFTQSAPAYSSRHIWKFSIVAFTALCVNVASLGFVLFLVLKLGW